MPLFTAVLTISLVLEFLPQTYSYLNLYMDPKETLRLLGIKSAELYYVRNGIINSYALSFEMPINYDVQEIYFTWQSLRQSPPMLYNLRFNVSNSRAMSEPRANITSEGNVPNTLSVFKVQFPCTGMISGEVRVNMQLNISIFSASNLTVLNFVRRKMCIKDKSHRSFLGEGEVHMDNPKILPTPPNISYLKPNALDIPPSNDTAMSTHVFYIAVGCACGVILLIALAVAVYYLNTQKNATRGYNERIKYYDTNSSSQALTKQQSQSFIRPETPLENSIKGSVRNYSCGPSPIPELCPLEPIEVLTEIAISRERISLKEVLLEGTFGKIYSGTLLSEGDNQFGADQEIIVKTVTDQARQDQVHLFLTESCMMKGQVNPNIYPIIGSCIEDGLPPYIIYPDATGGNLKKFLLQCRLSDTGSHCPLSTQQLVFMALQIIRGIQFLHRKRIIHKDIASRNCVIDGDCVVKITDNALSRDLFPSDYNCLGDNENRPVKWLALESIVERRFSFASDVWSFGVTVWEMLTLGQIPYGEIDPFEMAAYLREGYRIAQPMNCPDELFTVLAYCWNTNPDDRPKFSQLLICLQDFYTALGRYI